MTCPNLVPETRFVDLLTSGFPHCHSISAAGVMVRKPTAHDDLVRTGSVMMSKLTQQVEEASLKELLRIDQFWNARDKWRRHKVLAGIRTVVHRLTMTIPSWQVAQRCCIAACTLPMTCLRLTCSKKAIVDEEDMLWERLLRAGSSSISGSERS